MIFEMSWKSIRVLFVGDQPSSKNVRQEIPFVGTSSYKRLLKWIGELDLDISNIKIINKDDARHMIGDAIYASTFDAVLFLGKNAEKSVITYAYKPCPKLKTIDHPSPRNRKFNDPNYEKKMLKELKEWLYAG